MQLHNSILRTRLIRSALCLQALHKELADIEQEVIDVNSLSSVKKELVSTSILLHKDKGVKAYAACCIADLLRLYAPDAPFTSNELKVCLPVIV
jgi:sister chromatid cohesion protein PDS5